MYVHTAALKYKYSLHIYASQATGADMYKFVNT